MLALGMAVLGAIVDMQVTDAIGPLFQGCYLVGSVAAIAAVRRRSLFGPMVQPPLILAGTVPVIVLTGSGLPSGSDTLAKVLAISTPLINAFPIMAITTALTVGIGFYRMYRQRDPHGAKGAGPKRERESARQDGKERRKSGRGRQSDDDRPRDRAEEARRPGPAASGQGERRPAPDERSRRGPERPWEGGAAGRGGERGRSEGPRREPARIDPTRGELGRATPKGPRGPRPRPPAPPPDAEGGPRRPGRPPMDEPPPGGKGGRPRGPAGPTGRPPRRGRPWEDDRG